jgi:predicted transcriptional regulator
MTKLLDKAFTKAQTLSGEDQDALAVLILNEIEFMHEPLDDETPAAIQEGLEQARRGEFASDEEMEALWKKFGA